MRGGGFKIPESVEVKGLLTKRHWRSYGHLILAILWVLFVSLIAMVLISSVGAQEAVSNITVESVLQTQAKITWSTATPVLTEIEYGTSQSYGSSMVIPGLRTLHSVTLTDLEPGSAYHYRIIYHSTRDIYSSEDMEFRTPDKAEPIKVNSSYWVPISWFIAIAMFMLCVIYLYYFDREHMPRHQAHMHGVDEIDEPLASAHKNYIDRNETDFFIGSCLDKGMALESVRSTLEKSGYTKEGSYERMAEYVIRKSYNNGYTLDETKRVMKASGWKADVVDKCASKIFSQA